MPNPFVHIELSTPDPEKAKAFYGQLFAWNLNDMPMGEATYTLVDVGEDGTGGGMMKSPAPNIPPNWMPYVSVDDVVATTAKARSLGANVIQDNVQIPGMGAFSIMQDPMGAVFGIWQAKRD